MTTVPMRLAGKGVFKPGEWTVRHSPETCELVIEIVVEDLNVEGRYIAGQTRDFFAGPVCEDGYAADRFSFAEYIVNTNKCHEFELPSHPNDATRKNVAFCKHSGSE